jgi:hypothetical protein
VRPIEIDKMAIGKRSNIKETHKLIKSNMKKYVDEYNKYNFEIETQKTNLKEGDWVFSDIRDTGGNRKKLAEELFIGPSRIVKKVSKVSFLIDLPFTLGKTSNFHIRH